MQKEEEKNGGKTKENKKKKKKHNEAMVYQLAPTNPISCEDLKILVLN
jgi:hypothetical protein